MEKIPHDRYTKEFREEAARLVLEDGLSSGEAAKRLSLPKSTLETWVRAAKTGKLGDVGRNRRPLNEVEVELAKVKRELAMVRMERDILKKQPLTLPRSRCPVRADGCYATNLSLAGADESGLSDIFEWLSCLAHPAAIAPQTRGCSIGSRDQVGPPQNQGELRRGAFAGRVG